MKLSCKELNDAKIPVNLGSNQLGYVFNYNGRGFQLCLAKQEWYPTVLQVLQVQGS